MEIFTANQVNQVYAMAASSTVVATLDADHQITKANNLGSVGVGKTADGKSIYFKHLGAGGVTRSDLIEIANIINVKATPAAAMARSLMAAKVTLNTEALSDSKPVAGQDFVLRIKFQNPIGMSPENQYWKYGVVHATSTMSASDFYKKLALSIAKNMSRDAVQLIKVYVNIQGSAPNGGEIEVTPNMTETDIKVGTGSTAEAIIIKEVEQDWILGIKQQKPVLFTLEPTIVTVGKGTSAEEDVVWGDVVYSDKRKTTGGVTPEASVVASGQPSAAGTIVNSKKMADYEYFYHGERGDQYRMVNWPDYIPTKYIVDPTYAYGYDTVAIHYAYVGANHSVQKSEKDITFLIPADASPNASGLGDNTDALLAAIEGAINPADSRYATVGEATTSGKLAVFDSNGNITASDKAPSDIA